MHDIPGPCAKRLGCVMIRALTETQLPEKCSRSRDRGALLKGSRAASIAGRDSLGVSVWRVVSNPLARAEHERLDVGKECRVTDGVDKLHHVARRGVGNVAAVDRGLMLMLSAAGNCVAAC